MAGGPEAAHASQEGLERLHQLLAHAGIPLELKVAQVCQRLTHKWRPEGRGFPRTSRVVYGERDDDKPLREIDQLVQMYDEIRMGKPNFGLSPMLEIPIECKSRRGVVYYGLRGPSTAGARPKFAVLSELAGSALVRDCFGEECAAFAGKAFTPIASIEFSDAGSPHRISEEQLVYKAGAAIHDYILHDRDSPDEKKQEFWKTQVEESKVLEGLELDVEGHYYVYWRDWLEHLPAEAYDKFNEFLFSSPGVWHFGVRLYIPIICVDAPLFEIGMNAKGKLGKPKRAKWLLTSARLPGWPSAIREEMSGTTAEAALVLCGVDNLQELLVQIRAWFEAGCLAVTKAGGEPKRRAPLEAAMRRLVRSASHFKERSKYRSDYDHDDDLDPPGHSHSKFKVQKATKERKGVSESAKPT